MKIQLKELEEELQDNLLAYFLMQPGTKSQIINDEVVTKIKETFPQLEIKTTTKEAISKKLVILLKNEIKSNLIVKSGEEIPYEPTKPSPVPIKAGGPSNIKGSQGQPKK